MFKSKIYVSNSLEKTIKDKCWQFTNKYFKLFTFFFRKQTYILYQNVIHASFLCT